MTTPILGLSEIAEGVASQAALHNTALRQFEGRTTRVLSRSTTAPPGSPAEGHSYIIPSGATGAWAGKTDQIATWIGGAWAYFAPTEGACTPWVNDEDTLVTFDGTAWVVTGGSTGAAPFSDTTAIVKGSADATKRLRFEVDGFTAATTRVLTPQNRDYTIADNSDVVAAAGVATAAAASIASHAADTANPHAVTKAQVGLSAVPNVDATNASNITSGTLANARLAAQPFDATFYFPGVPAASDKVDIQFARAVAFPASLTGSYVKARVAATAQTDFDLQLNGTSIGIIRFAAAGTTATFVGISAFNTAAGDYIAVIAPASPDATLSGVRGVLAGTR
jgi:hypothetical protein